MSYKPYQWAKYGWVRFRWGGYAGITHWINDKLQRIVPEQACPDSFEWWLYPGTQGTVAVVSQTYPNMPGITVNNIPVNPVTGQGMPPTGVF